MDEKHLIGCSNKKIAFSVWNAIIPTAQKKSESPNNAGCFNKDSPIQNVLNGAIF